MYRTVTTHTGGVYDLGYHVVWCPKYRRPVLTGAVQGRCEELLRVKPDQTASPAYVANQFKGCTSRHLRTEFPALRSKLPTLWSRSYFVATVGAVSADMVRRYIDTPYERPWLKTKAACG